MNHSVKIIGYSKRKKLAFIKKGVLFLCSTVLFLGCGSASKLQQNPQALSDFISFVDQKSFEFSADIAYPMATQAFNSVANSGLLPPGSNAGAIQLIGISSYVKIYGDSVAGDLPFYGERQFGGGPMSKTGIEFKGIPDSYSQTYNESKERYEITFDISGETGRHMVNMILFPNKSANVLVTGNQQNSIRYSGSVVQIESDTE